MLFSCIFSIAMYAQDQEPHAIEMRIGYGGADGNSGLSTLSLAYSAHITGGLRVKPFYTLVQGGSIFNDVQGLESSDQRTNEIINGDVQVKAYRSQLYGLGLEKSINTDVNKSIHLMIGAVYERSHSHNVRSISNILTDPNICLLYTSPSPRDRTRSRMPSSA